MGAVGAIGQHGAVEIAPFTDQLEGRHRGYELAPPYLPGCPKRFLVPAEIDVVVAIPVGVERVAEVGGIHCEFGVDLVAYRLQCGVACFTRSAFLAMNVNVSRAQRAHEYW